MSYIILLPLIFNELRLSGDGIARKRRFGPTPVDHFVDANEMVYRLASHFLPDLVLSQMIIPVAITDKKKNANASSIISMFFKIIHHYCFYRLASHFLPDLVLSQMIIATTTARNAANVTIA